MEWVSGYIDLVRSKLSTFCSHILKLMVHKHLKTQLGNRTHCVKSQKKSSTWTSSSTILFWNKNNEEELNLYEVPSETMNLTFNIIHSKVFDFLSMKHTKNSSENILIKWITPQQGACPTLLSYITANICPPLIYIHDLPSKPWKLKIVVEKCSHWYNKWL